MRFAVIPIIFGMLFSLGCGGGDRQAGIAAYQKGDFAAALKEFRPLAEKGDAFAQGLLGNIYFSGEGGVKKDTSEAQKWWRKAAMQNDLQAQYNVAIACMDGEGIPSDNREAYMWFSLVAKVDKDPIRIPKTSARMKTLEKRMTAQEFAEAKKRADEWKPGK